MEPEILKQLIPVSLGLTITLVAFLSTYVMVPKVMYLADRFGIMDIPDRRRIHQNVIPRAGGIAVYVGVLTACSLVILLSPLISDKSLSLPWVCGMFLGSTIVFLTGLLDDLIGIKAFGKLSGQLAAVLVVYLCGIRFQILSGYPLPLALDFTLTAVWFLLIINAFNLIDGLDGLAAGIAGIAALGIAGFLIQRKLPFEACILFAVLGGTMGFLKFNRHPASIFLGDSGSNFLGFFMASMMIVTGSKSATIGYLWAPLLAVIIPAIDLALAVWRRASAWLLDKLEGKSTPLRIMTGDLEHLHHRLLKLNIHPRDAAATLCLINALFVLGGLMAFPYEYQGWGVLLVSAITFGFLAWRFILKSELERSVKILGRLLIDPKRPFFALLVYSLADIATITFSLLISIRITHPDFPIPVVFERASFIYAMWLPLGVITAMLIEKNILSNKTSGISKKLYLCVILSGVSCAVLGFYSLTEVISFTRAASNIVIFVAMNFLLLVFTRFLLSTLESHYTAACLEEKDKPVKTQRLENLNFYGRLFSRI